MENLEYREKGKELIDFIADYLQNIRKQQVFPNVSPGYMRKLLPDTAPTNPETWDSIMKDVKEVIIPGVTHWQSPYMHAYYPALNSYPSLLGDMISDAINCLGFTWASSPACTELETIVMDWLGKMIDLPSDFLHSNTATSGGGVIQTTQSEATFISLLAARTEVIRKVQDLYPEKDDSEINGRLIAYTSDQANSSVEKAGLIGLVKMRYLASDDDLSLRGKTLKDAIIEDRAAGLIPFYLCATLGTTGSCAFDNLAELGPICKEEDIYLHIDAAYAGSAFICPEFRGWMKGIEYAQSFAFNPSKWLMVHFDCTAMWICDSTMLHRTFNVDPLYLKHENTGGAIDYMHWQIGLSKRFRAIKLWCVLRNFGISGLQKHIRRGVELAKLIESLVLANPNFEIPAKRHLGMIVFRLKGENDMTEMLLKSLNSSGELHMIPASLKGTYIIRFTVTSQHTTEEDIRRDWALICAAARQVVLKMGGLWLEETEEEVEIGLSEDESGFGKDILTRDVSIEDKTSLETYSESEDKQQLFSRGDQSSLLLRKKSVTFAHKIDDGGEVTEIRKIIIDPATLTNEDNGDLLKWNNISDLTTTTRNIPTGGVLVPQPGSSEEKVYRKKIVPRKQMSVVFDPRASAMRRMSAASSYLLNQGDEDQTLKVQQEVDREEEGAIRNKDDDLSGTAPSTSLFKNKRGSNFGVSLLLSNTPHSPQFINGSYAAIFENPKDVDDIADHLKRLQTELSPWRQGPPPPTKEKEDEIEIVCSSGPTTKIVASKIRSEGRSKSIFESGGGDNYNMETEDLEIKRIPVTRSGSILFKRAIVNLFGETEIEKQGAEVTPTTNPAESSSLTTIIKQRKFKDRQLSLDSRLHLYSRAINDISETTRVIKNEEKTQTLLTGETNTSYNNNNSLKEGGGYTMENRVGSEPSQQPISSSSIKEEEEFPSCPISSPNSSNNNLNTSEDDSPSPPQVACLTAVRKSLLGNISLTPRTTPTTDVVRADLEEETLDHILSTRRGSLLRSRRIIDPPSQIPLTSMGGVKKVTNFQIIEQQQVVPLFGEKREKKS